MIYIIYHLHCKFSKNFHRKSVGSGSSKFLSKNDISQLKCLYKRHLDKSDEWAKVHRIRIITLIVTIAIMKSKS